ncbi:uncharacterized protein LOC132797729 [Drosophila nasuta]|uniref:uncharacterized protein LOC132797729 n=1 Tax=Drosophila nasuta TaxID=42062 RepID=UPI00295EF6D7|nr:uncharacterized protein LOC132797729 [Drosophila nasuta]
MSLNRTLLYPVPEGQNPTSHQIATREYTASDTRFEHINIDIVGPLPSSNGYRYCLTCIDRFSRWPAAIPLVDFTAKSVANALISGWFAQYGIPLHITTDLAPADDGVPPTSQWYDRTLAQNVKAALKCVDPINWSSSLHLILLGLRTTIKSDIGLSPAEMVYGTTLRVPGGFFAPSTQNTLSPSSPSLFKNHVSTANH